jgi:hypothetical protein
MPNVISFAWTTPALLAGAKTVTRRDWHDGYARQFRDGTLIDAFDRTRRNNGKKIATIRLVGDVAFEANAVMSDADYWGEGYAWLQAHPERQPKQILGDYVHPDTFTRAGFNRWRQNGGAMWVVRFELVSVESPLPLPLSRLFSTEIGMASMFWANRLAVSTVRRVTQLKVDHFRRSLTEVFAGYIDTRQGYNPADWHWDRGTISTIPDGAGEMTDPFLRYALDQIGIIDAEEATAVFPPMVATCVLPGKVDAVVEGGSHITLWSCRAPYTDDASSLPEATRLTPHSVAMAAGT